MLGVDIGRAEYFATLKGYNDLNVVLEKMFETNGELHHTSKWAVICIDDANHIMHLGNQVIPLKFSCLYMNMEERGKIK